MSINLMSLWAFILIQFAGLKKIVSQIFMNFREKEGWTLYEMLSVF